MKTKILTLALALAAMSNATLASTDNTKKAASITISPRAESGKLYLTYLGSESADLSIMIIDSKGRVISRDHVSGQSNFMRPYDISKLQNGAYTMKMIEGKQLVHESSFLVNNSKSAVRPIGNQRFQLTYKDSDAKDVLVSIFDKAGNLLLKDAVAQTDGFSRVYDLSKVDAAGYTFEVVAAGTFELHRK